MRMASAVPSPRRKPRENQYLFEVGVRGRKTGLTVPDSGIRDEHGLEPMDNLFSSPNKAHRSSAKRKPLVKTANVTMSSEEDMDLGESTIPEPTAVLTERKRSSMRMPPPRSKSPIKTFLQSPARRHPSLGILSSPTRGSIISPSRAQVHTSVNRRLDFSVDDLDRNYEKAPTRSSPLKRTTTPKTTTNHVSDKTKNNTQLSPIARVPQRYPEQDQYERIQPEYDLDEGDPYQLMRVDNGFDDQYQDEQYAPPASSPEVEAGSPVQATKKRRGTAIIEEPVAKKAKSRLQSNTRAISKKVTAAADAAEPSQASARSSGGQPIKASRGKTKGAELSSKDGTKNQQSKKVEKRGSSPSQVSSSPIIHRGPPRPRHNRGLYILRRETPDDGQQTRSGRHVIKPVAYWKNETIVYGDDEDGDGDASFLMPTVKEVIRADHVEPPKTKKGTRRGVGAGKSKKMITESESDQDDDELAEPWESEPGRVYGAIRTWDPEDPIGEESAEIEDEIALSSAAIITRDIAGASFKFAKTLTLPFFGSGMVDLPAGAVKKEKNSRRMQMVFFIFRGRVSVTVNENTFRIGKGGMFQVPRGNFYSIENDYDKAARIFFSQGCEVVESTEAY